MSNTKTSAVDNQRWNIPHHWPTWATVLLHAKHLAEQTGDTKLENSFNEARNDIIRTMGSMEQIEAVVNAVDEYKTIHEKHYGKHTFVEILEEIFEARKAMFKAVDALQEAGE